MTLDQVPFDRKSKAKLRHRMLSYFDTADGADAANVTHMPEFIEFGMKNVRLMLYALQSAMLIENVDKTDENSTTYRITTSGVKVLNLKDEV